MERRILIETVQGRVWICFFIIFWTAMFVWTGSARGQMKIPYPEDIEKIKKRGRIIVAQYRGVQGGFFELAGPHVPAHTPIHVSKGERLVGVDIDLASRIAEALGVDLELDRSASSFDAVCHMVALGKADIGISKLSATVKRAQYVRFTIPYARLPICLLVDRIYESEHDIADRVIDYCKEKTPPIGVWKQSALAHYLRQIFPGSQAIPFDNFEDQVQALLKGEVHFVLDDGVEAVQYLRAHPELSLRLRTVTLPDQWDPIAVAVSCDSPNLLAFLNLLIKEGQIPQRVDKILTNRK